MTVQTIISGSSESLPSVTRYNGVFCSQQTWTSQQFRNQVVPAAGTFKNLRVKIKNAPGSGDSRTFTLMKNGVATALTCTISGSSATEAEDTVNTVSVVAGDYVSLRHTKSGSVLTASDGEWTLQFEGTNADEVIIMGNSEDDAVNATEFNGVMAGEIWNATEANRAQLISTPGTIESLYIKLEVAPGSGDSRTFTVFKNNAATTMAIALTNSSTTANTSANQFSVVAGDRLSLRQLPGGTPTSSRVGWGLRLKSTTTKQAPVMGQSTNNPSTTADRYYQLVSCDGISESSESNVMSLTSFVDIKDLHVQISPNPGGGTKGYQFTLRVNGVDSQLTTTLSGTATTGNDTTNIIRVNNSDDVSLEVHPLNSPDTLTWVRWAFNTEEAPEPQLYEQTASETITLSDTLDRDISLERSESISLTETANKHTDIDRTTATTILRPISDKTVNNWNFSTGTTAWDLLDEENHDDDGTYIYSQTDNASCNVHVEKNKIPSDAIITSVTAYFRAKKNNVAADVEADIFVWEYDGTGTGIGFANISLQDYYITRSKTFATSPDADAWTVAEVNDMSIEIKRDAPVSSSEMRVTQMWIEVEYTTNKMSVGDLTVSKHVNRPINETATLTDGDVKHTNKLIQEAISTGDTLNTQGVFSREFIEDATLSDSVSKRPNKLATESISATDATVIKQTNKQITEGIDLIESFDRQWILGREFSNLLTLDDQATKKISKEKSESLTLTDTTKRVPGKALSEQITIGDTIARITFTTKSEDLTLQDGDVRGINRAIIEGLSVSDQADKSLAREITDAMTISDNRITLVGKFPQENLDLTDTLNRTFVGIREPEDATSLVDSAQKSTSRGLTDTISLTDSKLIAIFKIMQETANLSDSATKQVFRSLADQVGLTDTAKRHTQTEKSETITLTDDLITQLGKVVVISESLFLSDNISKRPDKLAQESITLSDGDVKQIYRILTDQAGLSDQAAKTISRTISNSMTLDDLMTKKVFRELAENLNLTDSKIAAIQRTIADSLSLTDVQVKQIFRELAEAVTISDAKTIRIYKNLLNSLTLQDSRVIQIARQLDEIVNLSDGDIKQLFREVVEGITITDVRQCQTYKQLLESLNLDDSDFFVGLIIHDGLVPKLYLVKTTEPVTRGSQLTVPIIRLNKRAPGMKTTTYVVPEINEADIDVPTIQDLKDTMAKNQAAQETQAQARETKETSATASVDAQVQEIRDTELTEPKVKAAREKTDNIKSAEKFE